MPELLHLNPWSVDYSYSVAPAVLRSSSPGLRRQAKASHRYVQTVPVTLLLRGIEIPYFEHFVREVLLDGSLKFTGHYADATGLQSGTVRIVGGAYSMSFNGRAATVDCELEIFR